MNIFLITLVLAICIGVISCAIALFLHRLTKSGPLSRQHHNNIRSISGGSSRGGGKSTQSESQFKIYEIGSGDRTILLIPGLGNGRESYNWNLSSEVQRVKSGLAETDASLQKTISDRGFRTISFDPPGFGENAEYPVPKNVDDYVAMLKAAVPRVSLVIGHSIGARVAQVCAQKWKCPYIMIDPTPDYILDTLEYRKHLDDPTAAASVPRAPANIGYKHTYEFVEMVKASAANIKKMKWGSTGNASKGRSPRAIMYSLDDADPKRKEKEDYFESTPVEKIKLDNASHWPHITHPEVVLEIIDEFAREMM